MGNILIILLDYLARLGIIPTINNKIKIGLPKTPKLCFVNMKNYKIKITFFLYL